MGVEAETKNKQAAFLRKDGFLLTYLLVSHPSSYLSSPSPSLCQFNFLMIFYFANLDRDFFFFFLQISVIASFSFSLCARIDPFKFPTTSIIL